LGGQGSDLPGHVLQFTVALVKLLRKLVLSPLGGLRVAQDLFGIHSGDAHWLRLHRRCRAQRDSGQPGGGQGFEQWG
jgi:hypothetical protein